MKTKAMKARAAVWSSTIALGLSSVAYAGNLVQNGGFESTTAGNGQLGYNTEATDWSTTGYNFVYAPGTADTTGAYGQYSSTYGNVLLWGPNNPSPSSANGLPATSPAGGNFVALDGDYDVGALTQTIVGLTSGATYQLSFYWGASQQWQIYGASTEQLQVSLGSQTQLTPVDSIPSMGFSGWAEQTFSYTASSASEVLSFLALGTPNGVPTFAVLDGVSLEETVPDTASTAMLLGLATAVMGLAVCRKRYSRP